MTFTAVAHLALPRPGTPSPHTCGTPVSQGCLIGRGGALMPAPAAPPRPSEPPYLLLHPAERRQARCGAPLDYSSASSLSPSQA